MKHLVDRARQMALAVERMLDLRMTRLVRQSPRREEPVELRNEILRAIEEQAVTGPLGSLLLPVNQVALEVLPEIAPALEAIFEADGGLGTVARGRLAEKDCRVAPDTTFDLRTVTPTPADWPAGRLYRLHCTRRRRDLPTTLAAEASTLTLVISGPAERVYRLTRGRIDIGRVLDVCDGTGRLVRKNTVCIDEVLEPGRTVSRRHAHIRSAGDTGDRPVFVLRDDGSRYGTSVVRNGETIPVHTATSGVRLQDGDEIYFGRAHARVRIAQAR